jgi:hypothetical protein
LNCEHELASSLFSEGGLLTLRRESSSRDTQLECTKHVDAEEEAMHRGESNSTWLDASRTATTSTLEQGLADRTDTHSLSSRLAGHGTSRFFIDFLPLFLGDFCF